MPTYNYSNLVRRYIHKADLGRDLNDIFAAIETGSGLVPTNVPRTFTIWWKGSFWVNSVGGSV